MAVAQGYGKTVTSGSVFAYDTGDTRNSYIGEPTVNLVPTQTISSWSNLVNVSSTGDSITPPIKGLTVNRVSRTSTSSTYFYSGNTWATTRASFGYFKAGTITQVTILGYGYNAGTYATFDLLTGTITAYQTVTPFIENAGEGWYRCGFSVTNGPNYPFLITLSGYTNETVTSGQYLYICGTQCEAKNHATPFVAGTRSATQGLLPLVGNSTIDLTNMSFDSNAQMTFDGTNDYISTTPFNPNFSAGITMECVAKWTSSPGGSWQRMFDFGNGASVDNLLFCRYGSTDQLWFGVYNGAGTQYALSNSGAILFGQYALYTATADGTNFKIYVNGQLIYSTANSTVPVTTPRANNYLGKSNWPDSYFNGDIPTAKIYNRALSAGEVRQNYLHYKTRFNLS